MSCFTPHSRSVTYWGTEHTLYFPFLNTLHLMVMKLIQQNQLKKHCWKQFSGVSFKHAFCLCYNFNNMQIYSICTHKSKWFDCMRISMLKFHVTFIFIWFWKQNNTRVKNDTLIINPCILEWLTPKTMTKNISLHN